MKIKQPRLPAIHLNDTNAHENSVSVIVGTSIVFVDKEVLMPLISGLSSFINETSDYYETGSQSHSINEFTHELLEEIANKASKFIDTDDDEDDEPRFNKDLED